MDTENTQQPTDMSPSQVSSSGGHNKEANEHNVASSNPKSHITYYCKSTVEQNQVIKEKILFSFKSVFPELQESAIHNYYFCQTRSKCDICELDKQEMTKDKKIPAQMAVWPTQLAKCSATEIWSLVYIGGKGMFCSLCHCTNTLQPSNKSKVWNCEPNVRYRPDIVRNHMYPSVDAAWTMHGDAIQSEFLLCKKRKGDWGAAWQHANQSPVLNILASSDFGWSTYGGYYPGN